MVIASTASRNVAFKVATMRDSITVGQRELMTRRTDTDSNSKGLGSEEDNKEALEESNV